MADPTLIAHSPIPFAGGVLDRYCHVCAFVDSAEEMHTICDPFVQEGIERGEKALHIVDPTERETYIDHYEHHHVPVSTLIEQGQFELTTWHEAYLRPGHFDQHAMLKLLDERLADAQHMGYSRTRVIANMGWGTLNYPGIKDLIEYEARVNYVRPEYRDPVICVYSTTMFGADFLFDILRSHPMAIVGGVLHENPYFIPPDEFLAELTERRQESSDS